jgi:hypothetical protein
MCWNVEASATIAGLGFAATGYAAYRREAAALWAPLGYFSVMEALQACTYLVLNDCESPANQLMTYFAYLHIVFQPFFVNALSLYFIPKPVAQRIAPWIYALCFVSCICMLTQIYPFSWSGHCMSGHALCGPRLCSVSGNWHIAWEMPLNGLGNALWGTFPTYLFTVFALPVLYGSWRMTAFHFTTGPLFAYFLTGNMNEWPAVWCLLSVGLLLLIVAPPIRRVLHVGTWVWPDNWRRPITKHYE